MKNWNYGTETNPERIYEVNKNLAKPTELASCLLGGLNEVNNADRITFTSLPAVRWLG